MYDITIIGAGVAGLTAAIYARRANKKVLVLEEKVCGGQIVETETIENYPASPSISGPELAKNIYAQARSFNPDFEYDKVEKIEEEADGFKIITDFDEYKTKTIIVAVGTDYRHLNLEHEDALIGHGVSFCATCDGSLYKDKEVAVFGGGNSALYSALYLSNLAKKVTLIHRRNEFRADAALVEKIKNKSNVEFELEKVVEKLNMENKSLSSITLKDVKNGEEKELKISALFVEIGRVPTGNKIVENLVELDEDGYIKAGEDGKTSNPKIFAAGDCRAKSLRQIVTAAADGASSASSAINFLNQ